MVPSTGVSAGTGWIDIPPDQRSGDAQALVYESAPLTEELQILGKPVARLLTAVDAQQANWIVKLSDVAPDGSTTLVTGGAMNGAHRGSSVAPQALEFDPRAVARRFWHQSLRGALFPTRCAAKPQWLRAGLGLR